MKSCDLLDFLFGLIISFLLGFGFSVALGLLQLLLVFFEFVGYGVEMGQFGLPFHCLPSLTLSGFELELLEGDIEVLRLTHCDTV